MPPDPARDAFLRLIEGRPDIEGRFLNPKRVGVAGGDGNFSLVFTATDSRTNRRVAVKVFRPDRLVEVYRFQCFCREAILLERFAGAPNVLGWVCPKGEFDEEVQNSAGIPLQIRFPYFVVELSVADVATILRSGSWGPEQKLVAFREMCKGVQRIHREEVVHRDVKPSNFLVMENGDINLSDFGTARHVNGIEPAILANYPAAPGDSRYCAPEMHALLHDDDPMIALKGDLFSLGATLFEMFSGTILGVQLFDASFGIDMAQAMRVVQKRDRRSLYLQVLPALDAGHPLPSIFAYASDVPPSMRILLDSLYKGMATLDFRRRLCDFETIFLKIEQCLFVLRNEDKVKRWLQQREVYRRNRLAKQVRRVMARY